MEFKDNNLFVVHDSEGFEAGQEAEFQVVVNFIRSRSRMQNINDRLHAIWLAQINTDAHKNVKTKLQLQVLFDHKFSTNSTI